MNKFKSFTHFKRDDPIIRYVDITNLKRSYGFLLFNYSITSQNTHLRNL